MDQSKERYSNTRNEGCGQAGVEGRGDEEIDGLVMGSKGERFRRGKNRGEVLPIEIKGETKKKKRDRVDIPLGLHLSS